MVDTVEITAEAIVAVLNERAATEPLIREIMRSATFEVAFKTMLSESEQESD